MHFFRIKIKRHRTQRRPSLTNNDQESSPAISARNVREPSPSISARNIRQPSPAVPSRGLRGSVWNLLSFRSKVSNKKKTFKYQHLVNE